MQTEKNDPKGFCLCMPNQIIAFPVNRYPGYRAGSFRHILLSAVRLICFGMRQFFYALRR